MTIDTARNQLPSSSPFGSAWLHHCFKKSVVQSCTYCWHYMNVDNPIIRVTLNHKEGYLRFPIEGSHLRLITSHRWVLRKTVLVLLPSISCDVRGALLTKGPGSSFAEAHKAFNSEPIHKEDEVKDQEGEVEDGRDKWRVRREGRREIKHTSAWDMDEMTRTNTWANVVWQIIMSADKHEKKVTCEVANHDISSLSESDREFHQNSFWYISSARCGPRNVLCVPQFCRAEHHEVAPFWWRSAGLRKHPVAIGENVDWIRFQPKDVHMCNRSLLDSNKEGILSIVLLELFRITRITLHCPCHESSLSNRHWMGCRLFLLQIGLKYFSMRMTLDLLHEFANTEVFCNWMWESRHSEINVDFLALREEADGLSTFNKSLGAHLICVYVFACVFVLI